MFSKISEILENPETAGKIKEIAASLGGPQKPSVQANSQVSSFSEQDENSGDSAVSTMAESGNNASPSFGADGLSGLLGGDMGKISSMMSSFSQGNDRHTNLLNALSPYLRESRQAKVGTAIRALQVIKILGNLK